MRVVVRPQMAVRLQEPEGLKESQEHLTAREIRNKLAGGEVGRQSTLAGFIEAGKVEPLVPEEKKAPIVSYVKPSYRLEQELKKCGFTKSEPSRLPYYTGRPERFRNYQGTVYVKPFIPHGVSYVLAGRGAQHGTTWPAYYSPTPDQTFYSP